MAYSGELKPLKLSANRLLPSRPPSKPCEPFRPTEAQLNKRDRMNALSIKKTSSAIPTVTEKCENSADLRLTTYETYRR